MLTDTKIDEIMFPLTQNTQYSWRKFARAIEAEVKGEKCEPVAWKYLQQGMWHITEDKRDWYDGVNVEEVVALFTTPQQCPRCRYCDGTGDVHSADGEYRGKCTCGAESQFDLDMKQQRIEELQAKIAELTKDLSTAKGLLREGRYPELCEELTRANAVIEKCKESLNDNDMCGPVSKALRNEALAAIAEYQTQKGGE